MKNLIFAFLGFALIFSACGKYEEGPSFSLASKKGRIANTWKIEKEMINGVEQTLTSDDQAARYEYAKDGKCTFTVPFLGATLTVEGTWTFDDSKEKIFTTTTVGGVSSTDTSTIYRLTSKEFWTKDTEAGVTYERHMASAK